MSANSELSANAAKRVEPRTCVDCAFCRQKVGLIAYCKKGHWQKVDGTQKTVQLKYLPRSKVARVATYCPDYKEA